MTTTTEEGAAVVVSSGEEDVGILDEADMLEEYEVGSEAGSDMIVDATGDDDGVPFAAELELHEGQASYGLAVRPGEECIVASAGGNDRVSLLRIVDNEGDLGVEILKELEGHTDTVEHVRFSHDGSLLASGSLDGTVRIWDATSFELLQTLEGPTEVTWLEWHPRGPVLAAGSLDGTVWLWQAATAACMQVFSGNATTSSCGAFTADGKLLVTGGDGVVFVWNPKDGASVVTYSGGSFPQEMAISLAVHPSMPVALVGFADGRVVALHTAHHQVLASLSVGEESVECVGYLAGCPIMLTADLAGAVHLWDANNYRQRAALTDPDMDGITCSTWLSSEGLVAVGCRNGNVAIWDVRSSAKVVDFPLGIEEDAVYSVVEVPRLKLLLAAHDDGKVRIYRL